MLEHFYTYSYIFSLINLAEWEDKWNQKPFNIEGSIISRANYKPGKEYE